MKRNSTAYTPNLYERIEAARWENEFAASTLASKITEQLVAAVIEDANAFLDKHGLPLLALSTVTCHTRFDAAQNSTTVELHRHARRVPYNLAIAWDTTTVAWDAERLIGTLRFRRGYVSLRVEYDASLPHEDILLLRACGKIEDYFEEARIGSRVLC